MGFVGTLARGARTSDASSGRGVHLGDPNASLAPSRCAGAGTDTPRCADYAHRVLLGLGWPKTVPDGP